MENEIQVDRSEYIITINDISLTLKFADKPNENMLDEILSILISSYRSRIMGQELFNS